MENQRTDTPPEGFFDSLKLALPKRLLIFLACALGSFACLFLIPGAAELDMAPRRALFILLFAASLWVTEVVPAFSVGILIIGLQIALLGRPGAGYAETSRDWEAFVLVMGNPLIWLFFGGFVLAEGMTLTGLDRSLARRVLSRLGDRPASVLWGVMLITFLLSMFMSNTATTAMMLAMMAPLISGSNQDETFARGLLLGIAVAANLGGMGSLIGTPPNAIAVGALSELPNPIEITFLQWMVIGAPLALILLVLSWLYLVRAYPARSEHVSMVGLEKEAGANPAPFWQRLVVAGTLVLTVGLWLTTSRHHMPTAVVSFLPTVLFTITGILGTAEIRRLNYDVLFLLAGGLALGQVVVNTGLSIWIVELLPVEGLAVIGIALLIAYVTAVLSNFMSNTAAANILIPIGITMCVGFEAEVVLPIALAASCAMCLPIATPPNALAFATGRCETRDFIRLGGLIGIIAPLGSVLWVWMISTWARSVG